MEKMGTANLETFEIELLRMMAVGASDAEMAQELSVDAEKVESHIQVVFKKIKAPNRFQAALWAAKHL